MGNSIQTLGPGVSLIAAASTWIEGSAIQQLQATARLPGMDRVVGLPDLHPGRGYPVGAAFLSRELFYPALIGGDIGCGMALWRTSLQARRASAERLLRRTGSIDGPAGPEWSDCTAAVDVPAAWRASLGTIGGGNHFAEVQHIDTVFDEQGVAALELDPAMLVLLVHSGSRGFGGQLLRDHLERCGHAGVPADSESGQLWLAGHARALAYAAANRRLIALRLLQQMGGDGQPVLDVTHNALEALSEPRGGGWLHRKGASPADRGPLVIPGSRGDYSWLVEPRADAVSLYSLAHGAGRKWQRGECRGRLQARHMAAALEKTALGSRVICRDRELIYEEAPQAYKSVATVIEALQDAGLIRVLARLRPVLTYKTAGECC